MEFTSPAFAFFAAGTFIAYHATPITWVRQAILLGSSLAFVASYFTNIPSALPVIAYISAVLVSVHVASRAHASIRKRLSYGLIVALLVLFLIIKSYLPVGLESSTWITVGISYIFFRALQLLSDIADEGLDKESLNPLNVILFLISFLTFAAGPIQSYQSFHAQWPQALASRWRNLNWPLIAQRTSFGAIKLLILTPLVTPLFTDVLQLDMAMSLRLGLSASAFLLYIYISFSGYMDWMVALGHALGFTIPENFHKPYRAENFLDLWNRWHITLSQTFKLYVFNPILRVLLTYIMPRQRLLAGAVGYFIVFFLLGSWHGAEWRFVFFGLSLGALAAVTKLLQTFNLPLARIPFWPVFSASISLGVLAIACVFTWPGWELDAILDVLDNPGRVVLASVAAIIIASVLVVLCLLIERIHALSFVARVTQAMSSSVIAASCWLLIGVILDSVLAAPIPGGLIYYQRF